jgi:uncharacterized protein DUF4149
VSVFLRIIGIVNAAIWFGAGTFFAFGVIPGVFSQDLRAIFVGEGAYPYYSGAVAMALFKRFFVLQYICGTVAIAHLIAEKLYLGRPFSRIGTTLVIIIFALGLAGGFWMQPKMEKLRSEWYSTKATPEMKEQAHHTFNVWHGISQTANVLIIGGLLIHLLRVTRSPDSRNYGVLFPQFRG